MGDAYVNYVGEVCEVWRTADNPRKKRYRTVGQYVEGDVCRTAELPKDEEVPQRAGQDDRNVSYVGEVGEVLRSAELPKGEEVPSTTGQMIGMSEESRRQ